MEKNIILSVTTIFFVVVAGDGWGLLHFSKDYPALLKCINDNDFFRTTEVLNEEDIKAIQLIVSFLASQFYSRSVPREDLGYIHRLINDFHRGRHIRIRDDNRVPWEALEENLKKALLDCVDVNNTNADRKSSEFVELPRLIQEEEKYGLLLNYILVNLPFTRENMIATWHRRALLRRYANDALNILKSISYWVDFDQANFDYQLGFYWRRRVNLFFDGRDPLLPYIGHRYSMDHPTPYAQGYDKTLISRNTIDFETRNPPASKLQLDRILNIHSMGPEGANRLTRNYYSTYSQYENRSMSSSTYYLEHHLDQFYRILFFFLELRARDIWTDEDDIYEGSIPFDVVPEEIQAILYNDTVYADYLLKLEINTKRVVNSWSNLTEHYREKNLIICFLACVEQFRSSTSFTTTTSTSTTVNSIRSSTTVKYEESKRGKGKYFRKNGKCYPVKHDRSNVDEGNGASHAKKFKYSPHQKQMKSNDKNYGFLISDNDLNELLFSKKSVVIEMLSSLGSY